MHIGELGKIYMDGEEIVRRGEVGKCMYVVQAGEVEVIMPSGSGDIRLSVLGPSDVFGEMALFTREPRSATVRAHGEARVLTIDKKGFLKRIHEDPSLAFRILQKMSDRIQKLNEELARIKGA